MGKPFKIKKLEEVFADIEKGARRHPHTRRVFLMDGDALSVKNDKLIPVLKKLQESFPDLSRISSYANGYNITTRTPEELRKLYENKLTLMYMGLESGSQQVLDNCNKASSSNEMIEAVNKAKEAGIKSSIIVLLGLGGRELSETHVKETIKALNRMQPRYLSFLSVMLIPGTPLYKEAREGTFSELSSKELLYEAYQILKGIDLKGTVFRSNHTSNYLALEGRLPHDKEVLLKTIEMAMEGRGTLRSEWMRGL